MYSNVFVFSNAVSLSAESSVCCIRAAAGTGRTGTICSLNYMLSPSVKDLLGIIALCSLLCLLSP